jgi:hypothetical protein
MGIRTHQSDRFLKVAFKDACQKLPNFKKMQLPSVFGPLILRNGRKGFNLNAKPHKAVHFQSKQSLRT